MKILAISDIHGNKQAIKKLSNLVEKHKPDIIISAGDHSWFGDKEKELLKSLDFGIPVLVIPGNHETPQGTKKSSAGLKHIIFLHQGAYELNGVLFVGCGDAGFSLGNADFDKSKSFLSKELENYAGKKVLITHEPPANTKADEINIGTHVGSESLRKFIKKHQPDLHICGHIHEAAGTISKVGKTIVVNPGPKGKIIKI